MKISRRESKSYLYINNHISIINKAYIETKRNLHNIELTIKY